MLQLLLQRDDLLFPGCQITKVSSMYSRKHYGFRGPRLGTLCLKASVKKLASTGDTEEPIAKLLSLLTTIQKLC